MGPSAVADGGGDRRPHVLYVAWGFPPSRSGGVYRALATVNAFAAAGFRVTVLTAARETFERYTGADPSLESQVRPEVTVVRIPFEWPALETDLRRWSALRMFAPDRWRERQRRRDVSSFPEVGYGPWRAPLEEAALAVHARSPVDLAVASANPSVDFTAADVLNRRHGVPYVMDYRDAWMLDVFDGGLMHPEGGRVDRLEKDLLGRAREVWFVNEPIRDWHARRHPDVAARMHVVANGFDPEFAPRPRLAPPDGSRPLTFGYIGTLSRKVPLHEFTQGWATARSTHPDLGLARAEVWGHLGYFSIPSSAMLRLVESHAGDGLTYHGPVPKTELRDVYDRFDALLLLLGAGRYVTSGKVFEYAATGLPIVSLHDPVNAAADVLRGYPLWFPVTGLSTEEISDALGAAAAAARRADAGTREACAAFAEQYRRDLQLRPRLQALADLPGRRTSTGAPVGEHA
ncbi:glycosyl transferase [Ornithinimicrobium sp. W1665]|uniref:glycosyl transferase n=1 Tax=Ornithinimicrobium sp. W1665 TaxID=3416666 RepID=UPI003CF7A3F2